MITETSLTKLLGLLGGLLILAFFANRLSRRTRVPDVVILITTGLILGPLSDWVNAGQFRIFTEYLGNFALILILFQAGYELHLRDVRRFLRAAVLFGFVGYGLSFAAVSFVALWVLKIPLHQALLLGAVFGCTSSTMVIPVLQQLDIRGPAAIVLILEAALGDIVSVVLVGSLLETSQGDTLVTELIIRFVVHITVAVIAAILAGFVWSRARSRLSADRFSSVLNIGGILIVYALVSSSGGSGLLAVLIFGLTLANVSNEAKESIAGAEQGILIFHSDLSFLVRSFFFVLLGASVAVIDSSYAIATVLILTGLVIARVISVCSTTWSLKSISWSERELGFLAISPRPSQCSPGDSSCGQRTSIGFSSRDGLNGDTRYESLDGARRISVSLASDCLIKPGYFARREAAAFFPSALFPFPSKSIPQSRIRAFTCTCCTKNAARGCEIR